jgi:hypothetical protein
MPLGKVVSRGETITAHGAIPLIKAMQLKASWPKKAANHRSDPNVASASVKMDRQK